MRKISAVIGANFGDEGKGLVTDYLASKSSRVLVIRYNGGAQAGHTVVAPGGCRHSFHHFGSGTFAGANTFLSKYFIVNPILFRAELEELVSKGMSRFALYPYIDKECYISTPYDMLINQEIERKRSENKHGSCGVGINETIIRNKIPKFSLKFEDLLEMDILVEKLKNIRDNYTKLRVAQEFATPISKETQDLINSDGLLEHYLTDIRYMLNSCNIVTAKEIETFRYNHIIFEGAQGLMLDMDYKINYPHLTPSKTGLHNIAELIDEMGLYNKIDVYFVTRAYLTRHGAGPLSGELMRPTYPEIVDLTNKENEHQGRLRFAHLDVDLLKKNILKELELFNSFVLRTNPHLVVTCLDQVGDRIQTYNNGILIEETIKEFVDDRLDFISRKNILTSWGASRGKIV